MIHFLETLNKEQDRTKEINKLLVKIEQTSARIFEIYKSFLYGYRVSKNSTIELIKYLAKDVRIYYGELLSISDDIEFDMSDFERTIENYIDMIESKGE